MTATPTAIAKNHWYVAVTTVGDQASMVMMTAAIHQKVVRGQGHRWGGAYIVCKGSFKGTKMGGGRKGSAKPHKDIVKGDRGGGVGVSITNSLI